MEKENKNRFNFILNIFLSLVILSLVIIGYFLNEENFY